MKSIKVMLLGLALMLAVITFHLWLEQGYSTDFLALVGLIIVVCGFFGKEAK